MAPATKRPSGVMGTAVAVARGGQCSDPPPQRSRHAAENLGLRVTFGQKLHHAAVSNTLKKMNSTPVIACCSRAKTETSMSIPWE